MSEAPIDFFRGAFDALDRRLDRVEQKIDGFQADTMARLQMIESRLSTIDQNLTSLGRGYAALQHRFDRVALRERLGALETP